MEEKKDQAELRIIGGIVIKKKSFVALLLVVLMTAVYIPSIASAATWVDVANWTQFKAAVESATTTHIRLTGNVEYPVQSATINPAKPEMVIDGNGFTLTDANSCGLYSMRLINKGNLKNITIQNLNIVGRDYYGMIAVNDSTSFSDVTITFDNIKYRGPQLSWARKSNFVIRNSEITIVPSATCPAGEVVECLTVRLEGNVKIVKNAPSSCDELFWVTGSNGGVTIARGANVVVRNNENSPNACVSGFVYYSCANIFLTFEEDSKFDYIGNFLFQKCDAVDRLTIGKRANVNIVLNGNLYCGYGVFRCRGTMLVDEGATFKAFSFNNKNDQPMVQLTGVGTATFNNPKEVFIYNSSTSTCNTGLAMGPYGCEVSISYNSISSLEYWKLNKAPHNNLPTPTRDWRNPNKSAFNAFEKVNGATVKEAYASASYFGSVPFDKNTAVLKDINVIRINGGTWTTSTIDVSGTVRWNDVDNQFNTRPQFVTLQVLRDGVAHATINIPSNGDGKYTFTSLEKYAPDGHAYVYTVTEQLVPKYRTTQNGNDFLNTLIQL